MNNIEPATKEILLSKGMTARVCTCHYDIVKDFKWHCTGMGYAARTLWDKANKRSGGMQYLHRVIASTPKGMGTDHINGNKMDCMCWNLRIVDQKQNVYNTGLNRRSTSGYKGVSFMKKEKRYRAYICIERIQKHLGCYKTAEEAALAYNEKAIELWGPYARLNIVRKPKSDTI
jgi:hypothetical protein